MKYIGDIRLGDTFDVKFTTTAASTGAPTTLSGSPVISAYPGNSTTELTAGITLTADFDSRTGLNNVRVVATSGNGYATATDYSLVITTGTVGGTSAVGYEIAQFSIEKRSALMPATAARTLVVDAAGLADANAVKLGPTGSGTAQTARDIGASVLLSSGTGTGQLSITSGIAAVNVTQEAGTAILTGTAQAGSANTITLANGTTANQAAPGDEIELTGGATAQGPSGIIQSIAGGGTATPIATMNDNWNGTNPTTGTTYKIKKNGGVVPTPASAIASASALSAVDAKLPSALGANGAMKADLRDYKGTALTGTGGAGDNIRPTGITPSS